MIYLSGRITNSSKIGLMLSFNANHTTLNMINGIKHTAVDNGCFSQPKKYNDQNYLEYLKNINLRNTLFAVAPDVVGDNVATKKRMITLYNVIYMTNYGTGTNCGSCISTCFDGIKKLYNKYNE